MPGARRVLVFGDTLNVDDKCSTGESGSRPTEMEVAERLTRSISAAETDPGV
ncbi:hypothetical protein BCR44DRAFT_1436948 [Catenaria anguillulae PL171]|uniref:Uncharacterized protein n=1 Tax=Catenaria anguillulae PL171 TaxID=765915 RepID=A0A1Y2HHH1_9FUNG|nr:hypothetical protein BCR44DRAFT_1436948 [Catenaria anguillulae PL171]